MTDFWEPYPGSWNADEIGLTPDDYREMAWELDRHMISERWKALKALWLEPVKQTPRHGSEWTVYDGYVSNRDDDWTFWRAVRASVGVILGLFWTDKIAGHRGYRTALDMAYWDAHSFYGGYSAGVLWLRDWFRIEIFTDGESTM